MWKEWQQGVESNTLKPARISRRGQSLGRESRPLPRLPFIQRSSFFLNRTALASPPTNDDDNEVGPFYATSSLIPLLAPGRLNRLKLAPIRIKQLHLAASRSYTQGPPPPPALGECCGCNCGKECVKVLHAEEVKMWSIRWFGEEDWKEESRRYLERSKGEEEDRVRAAEEVRLEEEQTDQDQGEKIKTSSSSRNDQESKSLAAAKTKEMPGGFAHLDW